MYYLLFTLSGGTDNENKKKDNKKEKEQKRKVEVHVHEAVSPLPGLAGLDVDVPLAVVGPRGARTNGRGAVPLTGPRIHPVHVTQTT